MLHSRPKTLMYARTLEGHPKSDWQKLYDHLVGVARRASEFASFFDSRDWGFCSGLWHDLGKYSDRFQAKLEGAPIAVEHSGVGAAFAVSKKRDLGLPLAFVIAGHHTGLADYITGEPGRPSPSRSGEAKWYPHSEGCLLCFPEDRSRQISLHRI